MAKTQDFKAATQGGAAAMEQVWKDLVADLAELRAAHVALTAKLDADGDLTDTDFGSETDPAAMRTVE